MLTTTTILDSRDSHPALPWAGCDTRDQAKGVITLRQHILRLTRGAVFLGAVLLLGAVPAFAQLAGHVAGTDGTPLENIKIETLG